MSKEIRFCWEKNKKRRKSKVFDSLPSYDRLPANTFGLGKRAQCGANFFLYECYLFLFKEVESLGFHCIKVPDPRGISNFHDPMLEYLLKGNVKISFFPFFLSFHSFARYSSRRSIQICQRLLCHTLSTIPSRSNPIFTKKDHFQNGGETILSVSSHFSSLLRERFAINSIFSIFFSSRRKNLHSKSEANFLTALRFTPYKLQQIRGGAI